MKSLITEEFLLVLERNNIYQKRTGMNRIPHKYVNRMKAGEFINYSMDTVIEEFSTFAAGNNLFSSGAFSSLASGLPEDSQVGRYFCLATDLKVMGFRHPIESVCMNSAVFNFGRENVHSYFSKYEAENSEIIKKSVPTPQNRKSIKIGNDVWIGSNVTLARGVSIGDGAVVAANSVVVKDVDPYSIVGGNPAKHIKFRFQKEIIEGLNYIKWWDYELGDIMKEGLDFSNPEIFIEEFIKNKNIRKISLKRFSPYLYFNHSIKEINKTGIVVSFHGKALGISRGENDICFVDINAAENDFELIRYDKNENRFTNENIKFEPCLINNGKSIAIKKSKEKGYLCACPDNTFRYVEHIKEWETFIIF